jgi:hypothetical protein
MGEWHRGMKEIQQRVRPANVFVKMEKEKGMNR